jgi:predicted nucleotidyltransferase
LQIPECLLLIGTESDVTLVKWLENYIGKNNSENGEIAVIDLSIVPTDILHIVVSVISRIIFEALQRYRRKNNQLLPTVLVMEEAHNFISRSLIQKILIFGMFGRDKKNEQSIGKKLQMNGKSNRYIKDNRIYLPEIVENLKQINPYKIILFGSYANGVFSEDSDLDMIVILDSLEIAKNYEEKMKNRLLVRSKIYELSKKVAIDLLVYTKSEYEIISKSQNSFFDEIKNTGRVLYEKTG